MATWAMTTSTIFIPVGITMAALGISEDWPLGAILVPTIFAVLGFIFWILAFRIIIDQENTATIERIESEQRAEQRHQEILRLLSAINSNIRNTQNVGDKHES